MFRNHNGHCESLVDRLMRENFGGRTHRNDPSGLEHHDAVGILRGEIKIMEDNQHPDAFAREPGCNTERAVLMR